MFVPERDRERAAALTTKDDEHGEISLPPAFVVTVVSFVVFVVAPFYDG
ncbi:MAG TPA: hypothetical protein VL173_13395 [Vicinamibacterales bacterium]|nr:hypothetical protein [Vicinamibacterales bacterium]